MHLAPVFARNITTSSPIPCLLLPLTSGTHSSSGIYQPATFHQHSSLRNEHPLSALCSLHHTCPAGLCHAPLSIPSLQLSTLGHPRARSGPGTELSVVLSSTSGFLSGLVVLREHKSLEVIGWDVSKLSGNWDIWCASQRVVVLLFFVFLITETKCFASAAYDRFYIFSMMSDESLQIKFC